MEPIYCFVMRVAAVDNIDPENLELLMVFFDILAISFLLPFVSI